jgi:hypothetical protein
VLVVLYQPHIKKVDNVVMAMVCMGEIIPLLVALLAGQLLRNTQQPTAIFQQPSFNSITQQSTANNHHSTANRQQPSLNSQ